MKALEFLDSRIPEIIEELCGPIPYLPVAILSPNEIIPLRESVPAGLRIGACSRGTCFRADHPSAINARVAVVYLNPLDFHSMWEQVVILAGQGKHLVLVACNCVITDPRLKAVLDTREQHHIIDMVEEPSTDCGGARIMADIRSAFIRHWIPIATAAARGVPNGQPCVAYW